MKVPEFERQVAPGDLPGVRQNISADASNFMGGTERAVLEYGSNAMQNIGHAAMSLQLQHEQEANRTRVQDAINQFETRRQDRLFGQNGALNQRGEAVFSQQNGKPLTDNVTEDLHQDFGEIADSLGNDEQKRLFAEHAQSAITHTRGQLLQHEGEQYRVYQRGVGLATIDTQQKTIGLNYNNSELVRKSLDAIHSASVDLGKLEGYGEEYGAAQAQKHKSDALNGAIESALAQNDHASATKILHDFAPDMDTNDMLKAYQTITKEHDARVSFGMAQNVMSTIVPRLQTSDGDRAVNILFNAESGSNHFVPGTQNPVTSSKGAIGIAQVMPTTGPEAAKLAGLDWDENRFRNDPDYNKALGTAYFNNQLKTFRGDLGMAYAAYNAGPGATHDAIEKASKEGGNWLSYLPKETQAYVTNNMNAYAAGEGQYKRPTLADAHTAALEHIGPNATPNLRKQVLDEVTNQYEEQTKAIKQREEEGTAEAMRQLLQNGGKFSALPVNVRSAVPPNQVDNLMNFGRKVSEGEPVSTDWSLYYKLKTDPALLRNTNLMAFRDKLNDTEFKQLTGEQQSAANGSHTETRSAKDILQGYMREAGIDPTPKDDDEKGAAVVGKIWSVFDQRISDAEQEKGKKLNAEDIQKVAAQLFTKVGVKGLLYGTNEKPAILIDSKKDKVAVPDEERAQIINAWRIAKPGQAITEDDIFYMYAKHNGLL